MGIWDDDETFKNLSNNKDLRLKRLSWQCSNLMCGECDGFIHYKFPKVKAEYFNIKTGKKEQEIEDYVWDTNFESVQLEGGVTQNPENTPEGTRCQCHHCHGRPGYDKWKKEYEQKKNEPVKHVKVARMPGKKQNELSDEERERLK